MELFCLFVCPFVRLSVYNSKSEVEFFRNPICNFDIISVQFRIEISLYVCIRLVCMCIHVCVYEQPLLIKICLHTAYITRTLNLLYVYVCVSPKIQSKITYAFKSIAFSDTFQSLSLTCKLPFIAGHRLSIQNGLKI